MAIRAGGNANLDERVVRVFVSSTFRDMAAERDVLVRTVFPQVRELCAKRGVAFTEIDMRWGLTDEEVAEGQVLPLCLAEIDRCKPFFIGLLGERYGWVPDSLPDGLADRQPWLLGHTGTASVTELEILYGVLDDAEMDNNAFFYFRDPAYIGSPRVSSDTERYRVDRDAFREDPDDPGAAARTGRLDDLKDRIRDSDYPVREGFADPDQLGEWVLADLTAAIDQRFPEGEAPEPWEVERRQHEFFARSRSAVYVGRASYREALDDFVDDGVGGDVCVVLGESGSGKSALLAKWVTGYRSRHPETVVVAHYAGSSAKSAELVSMLSRLNHELGAVLELDPEAAASLEPLIEAPDPAQEFRNRLAMAGQRGRVVLVVDALNQLDDDGQRLGWLPEQLPSGVSLVVSTLAGLAMEELRRREWLDHTVKVRPLEHDERRTLIREYLGVSAKQLSEPQTDEIVALPHADSPLYLRVLLDELRAWGRHESLTSRLRRLTRAETIPDLLEVVLAGYEADLEDRRPGLVGDTFSLIWASRQGLAEAELADLLGDGEDKLPAAWWAPLRAAAATLLIDRDGRYDTAHAHIAAAVEHRYVPTGDERGAAHERLAAYFVAEGPTLRGLEEAPYQLAQLGAWGRLAGLLADPVWFVPLWDSDPFAVQRLWSRIHDHSDIRAGDAYTVPASDSGRQVAFLIVASNLLRDMAALDRSLEFLGAAAVTARAAGDTRTLGVALGNQALIHQTRGELDRAMELLLEQERICQELGDPAGLGRSLGNQAFSHGARGELDRAMELLLEQERICRELRDPAGLQVSLGNQALIHHTRGELDRAMELHLEKEQLCRELGDRAGLRASLGNRALIHRARGELDRAMELLLEQERICRELGDPAGLHASLGNQAVIHRDQMELDRAMELLLEQERICRELGNPAGLQVSLGNQALIHGDWGELDRAMELLLEKERICRELGNPAGLARSLANQALILRDQGDEARAAALLAEALDHARLSGDAGLLEWIESIA